MIRAPRPPLEAMLEPRSVALVGASARAHTIGAELVRQACLGGAHRVHCVNPRYERIGDLPCHPTLDDLPETVDVAVLAVPNSALPSELERAAAAGIPAAVVFASAHGTAEGGEPIAARLAAIACDAGMAVCGPNGMGFVNVERGVRLCGFHQPRDLVPGGVTFLSHSGSLFSAMLHNRRDLRFNLVVSSGSELVTTMDEYLSYAVAQESTRAVGVFLETIRRPDAMATALDAAASRDIPVVALKVGRSERARAAVVTHSAAIAGEHDVYEAFFDAHGVASVRSVDELVDTLELLAAGRHAAPGALGSVHDSGGERALLLDTAAAVGVPIADVTGRTRARLAAVLDPGLEPSNPVDAWGTGRDARLVVEQCLGALADDPEVGAVALCVDLTAEADAEDSYAPAAIAAAAATPKPVVVLANASAAVDPGEAAALRGAGVPVLEGTETGLRAVGHLFARRDLRALPAPTVAPAPAGAGAWAARLAGGATLDEVDTLAMVSEFGVQVVPGVRAGTAEEAVAAAEAIGYPVAVKTATGLVHKSRAGGVRLGCHDAAAVYAAYADLQRLGASVTVQAMVPWGAEVLVGIVHDEQFGPAVVVATGGTGDDATRSRTLALPPLDEPRARRLLARHAQGMAHHGRVIPPAASDALVDVVVAVGAIAIVLGEHVDELDLNPVVAHDGGCTAVDGWTVGR